MSFNQKTLWRILSIGMIVPGTAAFIFSLAAVTLSDDPLAVIFIPLVLLPSIPPVILGWFMWKGKMWAVIALRAIIAVILLGGLFLNMTIGLNVFGFKPFSIPFVSYCLAWFILSYLTRADAG